MEESPVVDNFFRSSAIDKVRQNDIRSANKTESKVKTRSQSRAGPISCPTCPICPT